MVLAAKYEIWTVGWRVGGLLRAASSNGLDVGACCLVRDEGEESMANEAVRVFFFFDIRKTYIGN